MQSSIVGTTMPVLEFVLEPNEAIISEAGQLSWMASAIQMTTHTQLGGGGGIFGAIKRVAGGGTLFMTEYRAMGGRGELAFATKLPGHIVPVEVSAGHEFMIHRHGFLCATPQIQIGVGFQQSLGAGIFGGDGFLLQRLTGQGTAWLELSGELVIKDLQAGRNPTRASRTRRRFPVERVFPDHHRSRHQEHHLRRRRTLSRGAHRTGPHLAADSAHRETGARTHGIHASSVQRSRQRRSSRRHRRLHIRRHEIAALFWVAQRFTAAISCI